MKYVSKELLGLIGTEVMYWDFDAFTTSRSPADQCDLLKEDLVQVRMSATHILDIGWYPSFDAEGRFKVLVIGDGDWESPSFHREATTWSGLRIAIKEALATASSDATW